MNNDDAVRLLDRLAAGLPTTTAPLPSLLTVGRAAARRRRRSRVASVATGCVLVLGSVGLGLALKSGPEAGEDVGVDRYASRDPAPIEGVPVVSENGLVAGPAAAHPGEVIMLTFPQHTVRGYMFTLTATAALSRTTATYYLHSDRFGTDQPTWSATPPAGVFGIGIVGEGPDTLVIPESAEPGEYELCVKADPELCVSLTVESQ